jgi:hypothetical protein
MEYLGNNPNGLNQQNKDTVSLFVSGSRIASFSSQSVDVVGNFSASKIQTNEIDSFGNNPLQLKSDTQISGSLNVSSSITASLFRGDGSGLFNISAASIGDINQIKSGSIIANISPNKGLLVNTGVTIDKFLIVTGSGIFKGDLNVAGKINTTELFATYISSSIIYASGSNKFGDASNDKQEITGSLSVSGSMFVTGDTIPTDETTN